MKTNTIIEQKYDSNVHNLIKLSSKDKAKFKEEMENYSNNFLKEYFGISLHIPIEICGRLTRAGGSFHYKKVKSSHESNIVPIKIKMSERFVSCALLDKEEGVSAILDVLNHELVHYALCKLGKDFGDGDLEFEQTLAKLNIGSSGATADKKRLSPKKNVWYLPEDIYYCPIRQRTYTNKHTQKEQNWSGKRTGFRIVKLYF